MTKTQIHFQKPIKHRETTIAAATEGADERDDDFSRTTSDVFGLQRAE